MGRKQEEAETSSYVPGGLVALWLACAGGAKRVPWSLALTSTTLRGLPVQEQAAAGPAKGKEAP